MLRSDAQHIWTSNYDDLFEKANTDARTIRSIIHDDESLLKEASSTRIVIKMKGDFEAARFRDDLNWGLVFLQEQFDRAEQQRPEIWRRFEDDYRHKSILFVGMSFRDPVLRRIVAVARQRIPRTQRNHYIFIKRDSDPVSRVKQVMFAENLRRASICTVFRDSYEEIADCVARIAMISCRPIVGFSGDVGTLHAPVDPDRVADGLLTTPAQIHAICHSAGRELARKGFRITSGCAPFVGIPAVEAASEVASTNARFYLRRGGGTKYTGRAAVVVSKREDYESMRQQFIPELSVLIAIAGLTPPGKSSGPLKKSKWLWSVVFPSSCFPVPAEMSVQLTWHYGPDELCIQRLSATRTCVGLE